MSPTPFGKSMRDNHFLFAPGATNLNHGSFGGYPKEVRTAMRSFQDQAEAEPDKFIRYTFPPALLASRAAIAQILHCPIDSIVLLPNVTTATNTVLRNLRYEKGDKIVYFSGVYGALEKTIEYVVESTAAEAVKMDFTFPKSDEEIIRMFKETLERHRGSVKVAVFDTIVSMPGMRMPFERLVEICREERVLSMIDGAHGIGHIPLDLGKLDPDFFVSNCHKWLFVPRSVAAFYVPKRNQHLIRSTLPTSHGFVPKEREGAARAIYDPMPSSGEKNAMIKQFEYFGTIDNAPYLCILPALKFRDEVCGGEEKIMKYCTSLAAKAEKRLAEILGTETMEVADEKRCFFAHAKLPLTIGEEGDVKTKDVAQVTEFMNTEFVNTYQTYIYILYYDGAWWARLSITIYLDLEDCEYGGKVLKELCERVKRKEHLTN